MESSLQSLEPDPAGYIRQEFLEGELEQGLTLIGNLTEALTNEANSIMDSVSDIVALPHLDDSAVQEGVITSKKKRDDTVQKLNEFDYSQTGHSNDGHMANGYRRNVSKWSNRCPFSAESLGDLGFEKYFENGAGGTYFTDSRRHHPPTQKS